jgi:hypothetical protein
MQNQHSACIWLTSLQPKGGGDHQVLVSLAGGLRGRLEAGGGNGKVGGVGCWRKTLWKRGRSLQWLLLTWGWTASSRTGGSRWSCWWRGRHWGHCGWEHDGIKTGEKVGFVVIMAWQSCCKRAGRVGHFGTMSWILWRQSDKKDYTGL